MAKAVASTFVVRPANTIAYAAGQQVGAAASTLLTFTNTGLRLANGARINGATLRKSTNTAAAANFLLHLFETTRGPGADQAAYTALTAANLTSAGLASANREHIATIPLDMTTGGNTDPSGNNLTKNFPLALPIQIGNLRGLNSLVGYLIAADVYAPGSGEIFDVSLWLES